jgi:hypothetical protein
LLETTVQPEGAVSVTPSKSGAKTVSIKSAMNRFLSRAESKRKYGAACDNDFAMLALTEYINSFGHALLRAQLVAPTIVTRATKTRPAAVDIYEMAAISPWLRGFRHFFLEYKMNATAEVKTMWTRIVSEFIGWCIECCLLPLESLLDFEITNSKSIVAAAFAKNTLRNALAHKKPIAGWEDCHSGEPLYMVSRVKSGRLYFIYCAGSHQYDYQELGPVAVPRGVTDLIQPGWCVEATFGMKDGTWHFATVGTVVAV